MPSPAMEKPSAFGEQVTDYYEGRLFLMLFDCSYAAV
jgi:hypothetical protein